MTPRPHILIVDDEAGIRESLASILKDEGYQVDAVGSAEEALERSALGGFEVVLLDVWLPGIDGLEAAARIAASAHSPPTRVILMAASATEVQDRSHVDLVLQKPFRLEELAAKIKALCGE